MISPRLLAFSDRLCWLLLRAYPAAFRERFAAEMAQVFRSLCRQAYRQSGVGGVVRLWLAAGGDWIRAALAQWWLALFKGRMGIMHTVIDDHRAGLKPLSVAQAGLAALPFLAFGIASLVDHLQIIPTNPAGLVFWQNVIRQPYLWFYAFVLLGLGAGILAGFPRWAFSFLGWGLLFGWWWSNGRFAWVILDWKVWLPLLGVILIALLVCRSWQPLRTMLSGVWRDWALLSLAIYTLYTWAYMLYDENHHPYLPLFIILTTLAAVLGAWGYFRAGSPLRQVLALMAGLLAATLLEAINSATWDFAAYYGLPESAQSMNLVGLIFFAVLALIMLGNGLLARWRLRRGQGVEQVG